ncbi:hypothetical protein [Nonomuraea sp. NPDC005501]|uniref:hypothetical protein n=1 Tax=Nonomuraea sp. NPDC005501 TaxID=3156884 RepID=UPI0033B70458
MIEAADGIGERRVEDWGASARLPSRASPAGRHSHEDSSLREAGWRPVAAFAAATAVNVSVALGPAVLLCSGLSAT